MTKETILKPIWKWQITIPLEWRISLGIDKKPVRAILEKNRVILEPIEEEKIKWDIDLISLNELNEETRKSIAESEKNYKTWNTDYFISHNDFWKDV